MSNLSRSGRISPFLLSSIGAWDDQVAVRPPEQRPFLTREAAGIMPLPLRPPSSAMPGRNATLRTAPAQTAAPSVVSNVASGRPPAGLPSELPSRLQATWLELRTLSRDGVAEAAAGFNLIADYRIHHTVAFEDLDDQIWRGSFKETAKKLTDFKKSLASLNSADRSLIEKTLSNEMGSATVLETCTTLCQEYEEHQRIVNDRLSKADELLKRRQHVNTGLPAAVAWKEVSRQVGAFLRHTEVVMEGLARSVQATSCPEFRKNLSSIYFFNAFNLEKSCYLWFKLELEGHGILSCHNCDLPRDNHSWGVNTLSDYKRVRDVLDLYSKSIGLMHFGRDRLTADQHHCLTEGLNHLEGAKKATSTRIAALTFHHLGALASMSAHAGTATAKLLHENRTHVALPQVFVDWISNQRGDKRQSPQSRIDMLNLFAEKFVSFGPDSSALRQRVSRSDDTDSQLKGQVLEALQDLVICAPNLLSVVYEHISAETSVRQKSGRRKPPRDEKAVRSENLVLLDKSLKELADASFKQIVRLTDEQLIAMDEPVQLGAKTKRKSKKARAAARPAVGVSSSATDESRPADDQGPAAADPTGANRSAQVSSQQRVLTAFARSALAKAEAMLSDGPYGGSAWSIRAPVRRAAHQIEEYVADFENARKSPAPTQADSQDIEALKQLAAQLRQRASEMARQQTWMLFAADPLNWARLQSLWGDEECSVSLERGRKKMANVMPNGAPYFEPYWFHVPLSRVLDPKQIELCGILPAAGEDLEQARCSVEIHPHYPSADKEFPDFVKLKFNGASSYVVDPKMMRELMAWLGGRTDVAT